MARHSDVEILAPRAARELVIDAPIVYQEYPKTMEHPQGIDNHFPPVIVNDRNQEQYFAAKGYEPPGKVDPFGFLTSRATEKTDDAIRLMNRDADKKIAEARIENRETVREAIADALDQVNDVIDTLRITHRRVPLIDAELARLRGKIMSQDNDMRAMAKTIEMLSKAQPRKSWWQRITNG
jgi:hypothetical protein